MGPSAADAGPPGAGAYPATVEAPVGGLGAAGSPTVAEILSSGTDRPPSRGATPLIAARSPRSVTGIGSTDRGASSQLAATSPGSKATSPGSNRERGLGRNVGSLPRACATT